MNDLTESQQYRQGELNERDRVLGLLRGSIARLRANKGYGWLTELDKLEAQVWKGTQQIPFEQAAGEVAVG